MKLIVSGFLGANKYTQDRLLPEAVGTHSLNQRPGTGGLRPWGSPTTVATVPSSRKTIYRFGRDVESDALYWFTSANVAHFVRGFIASDTSERTYYTGEDKPRVTDNTIALATSPYPTAFRYLGVPAPASQMTLTQTTAGTGDDELRYYTQTFVTDRGEESAPGPVAAITCKPGAIISFGTLESLTANHGITLRRIYRTQTGASGSSEFFLLREELATTTTGVTDDARALSADTLVTTGWLVPPTDLKHLTPLWNGIMAGISGRSVRYCEPYKPYAWPIGNETLPPDVTPVAIVALDGVALLLTNGQPRTIVGDDPAAMSDAPTGYSAACVSEVGPQAVAGGVVWPGPDGLMFWRNGAQANITAGLLTTEQWKALVPTTIVGAQFEGLYLGFYNDGTWKGFAIDPGNPTGIYFLSAGYAAVHFDELRNTLYVLDGTSIKKWNSGAAMTATFRSKKMVLPKPANMARLRVIADTYPATVRVYGDGVLRATQAVASRMPMVLPAGYKASEYQIEVDVTGPLTAIELATSLTELLQV